MRNSKITAFAIAIVVLFGVFSFGVYTGIQIPGKSKVVNVLKKDTPAIVDSKELDFGPFWQAWSTIEQKYVDINEVERQELLYGAISGLFDSLGDPYTVFLPPIANEEFQIEISGKFEGVGMEIGIRDNILTVVAPLKGTPAESAGIKAGDKIFEIDDKVSANLALNEAVRLIRGPRGTSVVLTVLRDGETETRDISIVRDVINIPVLDTETVSSVASSNSESSDELDDIFVIKLFNFGEQSTIRFRDALRKMKEEGKNKLIIDLRNNPGGFLDAAVDISSWFLPQGAVIVEEDFGVGERRSHRSRGYDAFTNIDIVILVNKGSASASEIVAGALGDHGVATIVGEQTFGKGSVQELLPLTSDTSMKITIAKWYTPNNTNISEKGLTPNVIVEIPEDLEEGDDLFMIEARKVLNGN
jgi:carboxyl-terminal processing protease